MVRKQRAAREAAAASGSASSCMVSAPLAAAAAVPSLEQCRAAWTWVLHERSHRMIRQVSPSVAVATLEEIVPMGAECRNPSASLPAAFTHASSSSSLAPPPGAGGPPAAARAGAAASAAAARRRERTVEIFETARAHWRGSAADKARCPYSIFAMRHGEVVSPRGVTFHPQLVEGPFKECKALVEGALREILDSFQACPPVFYLGSTTDLPWRWRDIQGRSRGQMRPRVQPSAPLVGAIGPLPHGVRGPLRRNGGALDRHIQEVRPRTLPERVLPRPARNSVGGGSALGLRVPTSRRGSPARP